MADAKIPKEAVSPYLADRLEELQHLAAGAASPLLVWLLGIAARLAQQEAQGLR